MDNNEKKTKNNRNFKIAGTLMFTKLSTEKNLGNIQSLEDNNTTKATVTEATTIKEEETVRQNLTNVPDTRTETETKKDTTEDKYNKPYKDYYCLPFGSEIIKDYSNMSPVYSKTEGVKRESQSSDSAISN